MKKIVDYNFNRQEQTSRNTCDSQSVEATEVAETRSEKGTKSERRMPRLSGGDERRGKLRKGSGICKQELIRACLNGATHLVEDQVHS